MKEHEIDFTLGTLTGEGKLKEHFNEEKDCHEYNLTESGMEAAKNLIRESNEAALFLFRLMWSDIKKQAKCKEEYFVLLTKAGLSLAKENGINIFRILLKNGFNAPYMEDEEFLEVFDPSRLSKESRTDPSPKESAKK